MADQINYLKSCRMKLTGLSQGQVGQLIGFKDGSKVSRHEAQSRLPDLKTLRRYERLYSAGLSELFPDDTERIGMIQRAHLLLQQLEGSPKEGSEEAKHFLKNLIANLEHHQVPPPGKRILAMDPTHEGFAFALFETDPTRIIDWEIVRGGKHIREQLNHAARIMERHRPNVLVVEETRTSDRSTTAKIMIVGLQSQARRLGIRVKSVSRESVRDTFARETAVNKHQIAELIAKQFPELKRIVPRPRMEEIGGLMYPMRSEEYWMGVFDAAAIALVALGGGVSAKPDSLGK